MLLKNSIFWVFLLLVLVQWYVPGSMILEQEDILKTGNVFKFKTAPIDPIDPFRGKYVALTFDANRFETDFDSDWDANKDYYQDVYVRLGKDSLGFAKVMDVQREKPDSNIDYVKASIGSIYPAKNEGLKRININYPFDRFYMEEFKAPAAEKIYREAQRDSTQIAYALVRIKNGNSVLEDVIVNDRPIADWVEENQELIK